MLLTAFNLFLQIYVLIFNNFTQVVSAYTVLIFILMEYGLQRELTPPFVDDGLLEIVGFRNAWHGLVLLAPNGHGTRLAQVRNQLLKC